MLARQTGSAQAGSYCWPLIRPLGYDAADEPPRPHAGAGLLMLSVMATPAQADAGCQFQLGFRALHDLDPDDVGECLEERHSAANGDAQQRTSRGLLAWRKADNWTAFTDGARTWINGPAGLVTRANTERFSWEASEPAASAPPVSPPA